MEDNREDDFMCIRVDGGRTIATYKGVTVVASKRKDNAESQKREAVKSKSWLHKLLGRLT